MSDKIFALIPGYQPTEALIRIAREMRENGAEVVVVDDGSGESWQNVFEEVKACATVLSYEENRGKGYALKHGLEYIQSTGEAGVVVTLDADGQHTMKDSFAVAECALKNRSEGRECVALGVRTFGKGTPFKSRAGNWITKWIYRFVSGCRVSDTQTGLRAFSTDLIPFMLTVSGERYEYEMNVLLQAPRDGLAIKEIPIEVIYINDNKGSHFNPVKDAIRVFSRIFAFAASSIFCFAIDYAGYAILLSGMHATPKLSYIGARIVSSVVNFLINRNVVFGAKKGSWIKQALGYYALALVIMLIGSFGVDFAVTKWGFNEYISKLAVDVVLSVVSFLTQRLFIFAPAKKKGAA